MQAIADTWSNTPPITRSIFLLSFALSMVVTLEIVSPLKLYFNWKLISRDHEYWRLLTSIFYKGELSPHMVFDFYLCFRYSYMLESGSFRNRPADFLVFILFGCTNFLFWAYLLGI